MKSYPQTNRKTCLTTCKIIHFKPSQVSDTIFHTHTHIHSNAETTSKYTSICEHTIYFKHNNASSHSDPFVIQNSLYRFLDGGFGFWFGAKILYPFQTHMARNHHIIAAFVMRLLLRRENPFSDALSQLKWIFTISERRNETKRKSIRNIWTNNNIIMKPFSVYIIIFV